MKDKKRLQVCQINFEDFSPLQIIHHLVENNSPSVYFLGTADKAYRKLSTSSFKNMIQYLTPWYQSFFYFTSYHLNITFFFNGQVSIRPAAQIHACLLWRLSNNKPWRQRPQARNTRKDKRVTHQTGKRKTTWNDGTMRNLTIHVARHYRSNAKISRNL